MRGEQLETKKKLRLLEYRRVSTLKQKKDVTIATQKRENNKYKERNKDWIEIVKEFEDDGKSGFKFGIEERPNFNGLKETLYSDDSIDGIFAYDLDRIGRDAIELQLLGKDFIKKEKKIITTTSGEIKQDTPLGKFFFGMLSLITQFDGESLKVKLKAGRERKKAENIEKGLPINFGFGRKEKVLPKGFKQKIIEWYQSGKGLKKVSKKLKNLEYYIFNEDSKKYIKNKGFTLSPATISRRLNKWKIEVRLPKYSKSEKKIREDVKKEESIKYKKKFDKFLEDLKNEK